MIVTDFIFAGWRENMNHSYDIAFRTESGEGKARNEDYVLVDADHHIFIIADGVGGLEEGDFASKFCAERLHEHLLKASPDSFLTTIELAIHQISDALASQGIQKFHGAAIGTTLSVFYIVDNQLYIANVGNSKGYGLTADQMILLTQDHSLTAELGLSEEEAMKHEQSNAITTAVGDGLLEKVYVASVPFQHFDRLLLCTDGITGKLFEKDIEKIVRTYATQQIPDELVVASKKAKCRDDMSVIVMDCRGKK